MRPEKNLIINEIKARVDKTPYVLLTDYTGMQVPQFNELRNRLSGAKAEFRVVKNTLLHRALADLPSKEVLQSKLLGLLLAPGSTLVRLINTPASQVAQVLKAYSDKGEKAAA